MCQSTGAGPVLYSVSIQAKAVLNQLRMYRLKLARWRTILCVEQNHFSPIIKRKGV